MNEIDRETAVQWARESGALKLDGDQHWEIHPEQIQALITRAIEYGRQQASPVQQEPWAYGCSDPDYRNSVLSKAQFDNCLPKNKTKFDLPLYAHPLTPPDVIGLAYALSKLIQGSEKCVEDEWGAGDAERIIPELIEARAALAKYEATK